MNGFLKKAGLAVALSATALTAAVPAEAQRWGGRGWHGDRGWHGGGGYRGWRGGRGGGNLATGALLGGVLGLGVGAAIASSNRGGYYDRGYYAPRGYYAQRGYYAAPPVAYYDDYRYQPRCYSQWRWDPYYGQNVRVQVCN